MSNDGRCTFDLAADEETLSADSFFELYSHQKVFSEAIVEASGINVVRILDGASTMSVVRALQNPDPSKMQANIFRKMLLSIVNDVRIVLVKLVDRICILRLAKHWTAEYRKTVTKEILEIYASLGITSGCLS